MANAATQPPERWTHNGHYHQVILDVIPAGCTTALDVGCGTGGLTRRLRAAGPRVTGIDRDEQCIRVARAHPALAERLLPGVRYRRHLYWRYSLIWAKPAVTPGPAPPR